MLKRLLRAILPLAVAVFAVALPQASSAKCSDASGNIVDNRPCGPEDVAKGFVDHTDAASGHHLLWTVTGPKGSAYLLGSLHFGTPAMFPLPAEITQAYESSQTLVVETNLNALDPAQEAKIIAAKAMYHDGTTLPQVLTPATWRQLEQVMKSFGTSAQVVERHKPWFVSLTLTSLALKRFGFDENLGIDNHFMHLAANNKPIIQLETFEQQLEFLNGFSAAEQEEMLKETFDDIRKGRGFLVATLKAWQTGDAHKIDQLMNEEFRESSTTDAHMYRVLIAERNAAMAEKLDRLLNQGGKYFVVLGAAHFVGSDGIVTLLRTKGYRVQQD
ncbi:MAG: TraB/GumN family protein [Gammaproteobacteria bacterium]|jgi:uncharacterized protein YbaP (TraB family)